MTIFPLTNYIWRRAYETPLTYGKVYQLLNVCIDIFSVLRVYRQN